MSEGSTSPGRRVLERALAWVGRPRRAERGGEAEPPPRYPVAALRAGRSAERSRRSRQDIAFRAVIVERLRNLERQLDEVKGRVNGLIFLLGGAVAVQFVLRLLV